MASPSLWRPFWTACLDSVKQRGRTYCLTKECYPSADCLFGSFFDSSIQPAVDKWPRVPSGLAVPAKSFSERKCK